MDKLLNLLPEIWQDWVIMTGSLLFFFALLPSIFSDNKPSIWTSAMTATVLSAFTITYWTLDLTFGTITTGIATIGWWILLYQKIKSPKTTTKNDQGYTDQSLE
jgi:uncharacterized membrane protein YGL010W